MKPIQIDRCSKTNAKLGLNELGPLAIEYTSAFDVAL